MLEPHPYSKLMNQNPLGSGSVGQAAQSPIPSLSLNAVPRRPEWDTAILESSGDYHEGHGRLAFLPAWIELVGLSFAEMERIGSFGTTRMRRRGPDRRREQPRQKGNEGRRRGKMEVLALSSQLGDTYHCEHRGELTISQPLPRLPPHYGSKKKKTGMRVGQAVCLSTLESIHAYVFSTLAPGRAPPYAPLHLHLFCEDDIGKYVGGWCLDRPFVDGNGDPCLTGRGAGQRTKCSMG